MRLHSQEYEDKLSDSIRSHLRAAATDAHKFVADTIFQENSSRMLSAVEAIYPSLVSDEVCSVSS